MAYIVNNRGYNTTTVSAMEKDKQILAEDINTTLADINSSVEDLKINGVNKIRGDGASGRVWGMTSETTQGWITAPPTEKADELTTTGDIGEVWGVDGYGHQSWVSAPASETAQRIASNGAYGQVWGVDIEGTQGWVAGASPYYFKSTLSTTVTGEAFLFGAISLGSGVLLLGTYAGAKIVRSANGGTSWTTVATLTGFDSVRCFANLGSGTVLAAASKFDPFGQGYIYRSTDSGESWSALSQIGSGEMIILSLCNLGGGIVLAGCGNGKVYKSTNSGASWDSGTALGSTINVFSIVKLANGDVLAGTMSTGKVYKSTNNGDSWTEKYNSAQDRISCFAEMGSGVVCAGSGTGGNVYRSTDYGENWGIVQRLGTETYVFCMAYLGNGVALAGTNPTGQIYKTVDGGATWSLVQRLGSTTHVASMAKIDSNSVIAGTNNYGYLIEKIYV